LKAVVYNKLLSSKLYFSFLNPISLQYISRNFRQFFRKISVICLFITLQLLLFSGEIEASVNSDVGCSLQFFSQHKDFEFYKITSYLTNVGDLVSGTLDLPFSKSCRIYLKDSFIKEIKVVKDKKGNLKIYLNSSYSLITRNRKVSCTLLEAFVLSVLKLPYSQENTRKITWFVDALSRKLDKQTFPKISPDGGSFPGMHSLLIFGYKLQPDNIIDNPVTLRKGAVWTINSEAAEILLESILSIKNGKSFLADYLKSICLDTSKSNMDVFYSLMSKNLALSEKECKIFFIKHLNDTASKLSINSFMPASAEYAANAFQDTCIVSYIPKNAPETIKTCSLDDLPEVWDSIDSPDKLTQKLEKKFMRLKSFSPFLLQKPIDGILNSLHEFTRMKDGDVFKRNIFLYKKEFDEAVVKEMELQKLLRNKERKHVRIPAKYDPYFQEIDAVDENLNELWPELNNYLTNEFKFGK